MPTEPFEAPIEISIHDLARGGSGVGRLPSGEVVFVPFTAPGDRVLIRIIERKKSYAHGELVEILEPSPVRVTPECPAFGTCGGCSWQHLPYPLQFETKIKGLKTALSRGGVDSSGLPFDEFPARETYHYRNRIQIRGNPAEKAAGFLKNGSHDLVPVTRCFIADERINQALPGILAEGYSKFSSPFKLEVSVDGAGEISQSWNERHGALGFRQIHDGQNAVLRDWVKTHAGNGALLLDLYGGNGNLSLPLTDQFRKIVCVDTGAPIEPPKGTPEHYHFVPLSLAAWCRKDDPEPTSGGTVALIDPPREGLRELFPHVERKLAQLKADRVILIGCDVDSFVRDSSRFIQAGFRLIRLGALDLFPQTPHLESLALFLK